MKKLITTLFFVLLSQQALAVSTPVAGIDFIDIGNSLTASAGTFSTNYQPSGKLPEDSIVDGSAATWVMGTSTAATLDISFGKTINADDVNLTLLFVGNSYAHSGSVALMGGSSSFSNTFELDSSVDTTKGYTGFNVEESDGTLYGIYALDIVLGGGGTFSGVRLDISNYSAVVSLVGTTAVTPVPVPAAVWLFGSGLVGLAGIARRRRG